MTEAMPAFSLLHPETLDDALLALSTTPESRALAGGTDLIVNMRRGLVEAPKLVSLARVAELKRFETTENGMVLGAGVTLADIADSTLVREYYPALAEAAETVAGHTHRQVATLGGNLCQDTRCLYYNQSHWWRKSNDFCLKYRGEICHVAPRGKRCRAAYCGDIAPALMVHDAELTLAGPEGTRQLKLAEFFNEDGAQANRLKPQEIIVSVLLRAPRGKSAYGKIRQRGAIDFPLAGVAVLADNRARQTTFTIALTGTNSCPILLNDLPPLGGPAEADGYFDALSKTVQKSVSPQRTTTIAAHYRRLSVAALAARLARQLWEEGQP